VGGGAARRYVKFSSLCGLNKKKICKRTISRKPNIEYSNRVISSETTRENQKIF